MKRQLKRQTDQEGAVLIVALIMLLVTTFVGFSTMETSNLEAKMATARDLKEQSFQTAETSIERGLADDVLITDAFNASFTNDPWPSKPYTFGQDGLSSSVTVTYLGDFLTEGFSATTGDSNLTIKTLYYTVSATASRANTNIESRHTQGVYVIAPSG